MSISDPHDDRLMGELAALADGSLQDPRRAELEAQIADDPELAAALADQRRAVALIRAAAAQIEAPAELRERLERGVTRADDSDAAATRDDGAAGSPPARRLSRRRRGAHAETRFRAPARRRRWVPSVALAGVAATVLAVVIALSGGPTVEDAAAFASQPPTGPAPPELGVLLAAREDGVAFPSWAKKFGWRASGTRRGEIDGRPAATVYYTKDGKTLAYTIVSGDALDRPDDARTVTVEGTEVDLFRADGRPAATWERLGRTCVLTGSDVPPAKLAELAGWRAKGDIAF